MLTIEARALGGTRPLVPEWSVPVPRIPDGDGPEDWTLRDLISHVVRHEVAAYSERQEARRFVRALSAREIDAGHAAGKITAGAPDLQSDPAAADPERAVAVALEAFEDGLYLVVLDGSERRSLDEVVRLGEESHVVFLRLTFLAGA